MDFFHFASNTLFGSYAPAVGVEGRPEVAVVLCYPFGQEYMRAHRAYRQLAVLLSRQGVPVLRFDYYGTGDSAGEGTEASFDRWVDDARSAMDEARRRSGAARVHLAGLRLGGAVAAHAALGRDDVGRLVLWDPVVRGSHLIAELAPGQVSNADVTWFVSGFPFTAALRTEVDECDLRTVHLPENTRVALIVSHEHSDFGALEEALESHRGGLDTQLVPSPSDWNYVDYIGGILLPRDMVRAVVDALAA
jgi:pimeloyl-ACP methyl ester carboxylesterase